MFPETLRGNVLLTLLEETLNSGNYFLKNRQPHAQPVKQEITLVENKIKPQQAKL